jgi:hypothetical protein
MSGRDGSLVPVGMMVAASMQLELGSGGSGTVLHFPGAYPHREKYDVFVSRSSNTTDKKFWKEISD